MAKRRGTVERGRSSAKSGALHVEAQRGWPVTIEWNGRRETVVEIADFWVVEGGWWREPRRRVYFRIRTVHRLLDVYVMGGHWTLSRVWD